MEDRVDAWTDDDELSGRKAFDIWRFTQATRAIPWDWADMGHPEKYEWIERARAVDEVA
jgi:light-regulated signal transduction histidine kinase (bacteriophytochrome)